MTALLAGCGRGEDAPSYDEASARAKLVARATARAAVGRSARIRPDRGQVQPLIMVCSNSDGPPRGTPVTASFSYVVEGTQPGRGEDYLRRAGQFLRRSGWRAIEGADPADPGELDVKKDDYVFSVSYVASEDLLTLASDTPCVAPKDPDHPFDP